MKRLESFKYVDIIIKCAVFIADVYVQTKKHIEKGKAKDPEINFQPFVNHLCTYVVIKNETNIRIVSENDR